MIKRCFWNPSQLIAVTHLELLPCKCLGATVRRHKKVKYTVTVWILCNNNTISARPRFKNTPEFPCKSYFLQIVNSRTQLSTSWGAQVKMCLTVRAFLISWGLTDDVKSCYVPFSSVCHPTLTAQSRTVGMTRTGFMKYMPCGSGESSYFASLT